MACRSPCCSHMKVFAGSAAAGWPPPSAVGRIKVQASAFPPVPVSLHVRMPYHHCTAATLWFLLRDFSYIHIVAHLCKGDQGPRSIPTDRIEVQRWAGETSFCSPFPIWFLQTKAVCAKKRECQPHHSSSATLKSHTLTSVFFISVLLTSHTHKQLLFLTSKNKFAGFFFSCWAKR